MDHRIEALLALYDGDILAVFFFVLIGQLWKKSLMYELMPLLKLKSVHL